MMVSVLRAPRPTDFRPNLWPANWKLWREDKFNTPGTVYDPTMWFRITNGAAGANPPNIVPCPDGPGIRFIADCYLDGDPPVGTNRAAEINSGPQWWRHDNHGRWGTNAQAQFYHPPFMITLWARYNSETVSLPASVLGTWLHNPRVTMERLGTTLTPEADVTIELDGDEIFGSDPRHTQAMHMAMGNHPTLPNGLRPTEGRSQQISNTSPDEWYQLSYLVMRDHNGNMRCMSTVHTHRRAILIHEYLLSSGSERITYHDAIFDIQPFDVIMGCWPANKWYSSSYDPSNPIGPQRTYDVRDFRVYVPPNDPRLSEGFRSNSPDASADVPPFWEIEAEIVGATVNVTITDAQPGADWSLGITEDDPNPPPPVTASGRIAWTHGTKNHTVTGVSVSGFHPTKNLKLAVTHAGRTVSVLLSR